MPRRLSQPLGCVFTPIVAPSPRCRISWSGEGRGRSSRRSGCTRSTCRGARCRNGSTTTPTLSATLPATTSARCKSSYRKPWMVHVPLLKAGRVAARRWTCRSAGCGSSWRTATSRRTRCSGTRPTTARTAAPWAMGRGSSRRRETGDPDSFTRFRPYLAHCFPVFPCFLRVFTVSTRRF